MSQRLAHSIRDLVVEPGSLAIFWISQAGFVYKTPSNQVIYVDPYLSNCVNRLLSQVGYGFKRIMMTPIEAEEVEADLVVSTHSHPDHFDYDAMPVLAKNPRLQFVAAPDCREEFEKLGVPPARYTILEERKTLVFDGFSLTGVYADHGASTPFALGVLLQVGELKVWQVGDTAYRPDQWRDIFALGVDIIIPPINGAFGNLDEVQAARLAGDAGAKVVIPCHYWMFAEHGGSPARFMDACKEYAPGVKPLLMSQAECFIYHR